MMMANWSRYTCLICVYAAEDAQALLELKAKPGGFQDADYRQVQAYLSVSHDDVLVQLLNFGCEFWAGSHSTSA